MDCSGESTQVVVLVLVTMVTDRLRPNAEVVKGFTVVNTASWTVNVTFSDTTRDGVSVTDITDHLRENRVVM